MKIIVFFKIGFIKSFYICHMKFLCKIVLFFFIIFLSTPTIISCIDRDVNIASFYNFSEEEEEHTSDVSFDEIQLLTEMTSYYIFSIVNKKTNQFNLLHEHLICNFKVSIFIPPPDLF